MLNFITLKDDLKRKFCPVLVVYGNDAWLKDSALGKIADALDIQYPEMNKISFEEGASLDDVLLAANTLPFFSKQKLVVAEYALPKGDRQREEAKRKIEKFALASDESCVLVFVTEDARPFDGVKYVEKVNCGKLDENSLISWITAYCRRERKTIDRFAAQTLCNYCLNDMARISTEIKKLCDYAEKEITVKDVENLVHRDTEYVVFDLGRAIAEKNGGKALSVTQDLLGRGEEVRSLFTVLYNFYRRMYYVRVSDCSQEQLAAALNVKEGAVRYARDIALTYKPIQLKRALDCFQQADEKLKAFFNDRDTLDLLILQLLAI